MSGPVTFDRAGLTRRSAPVPVLAAALLLVAVAIQVALPDLDRDGNGWAPAFKVTGRLGDRIELRSGTVQVFDLRVARSVADDDRSYATPGIWVLVDFRLLGSTQAATLWPDLATHGGIEYDASGRIRSTVTRSTVDGDPGMAEQGTFAFEVPVSRLAGAALTLEVEADQGRTFGLGIWDTMAVVDLGIDEAEAAELVRTAPARVSVADG